MTKIKLFMALGALGFFFSCITGSSVDSRPDGITSSDAESKFYNFKIKSLTGEEIDFSSFKGKKVLLVNTASKCGFTGQYDDLQKLSTTYGGKVVVIGFPCNQFGNQEPGSETEIGAFCKKNYGVTFLMAEKVDVKGSSQHPIYKWLSTKSENGWNDKSPSWNFCKYLVNEKGELINFYASTVNPMSDKITSELK